MKQKFIKIGVMASLLMPYGALAQAPNPGAINTIINRLIRTFNDILIPILFVFATLIFLFGVIKYVAKGSEEKAQKEARSLMLWGIIGLAVMLAIWGIVNVLIAYLGVGGGGIPIVVPSNK